MNNYSQLLWSKGGGIISSSQQASQVEGTASVLIGLGGTGVDCIRSIKTQVYERLKPDDTNGSEYRHIQFLGIDCPSFDPDYNYRFSKNKFLDEDEYLPIGDANIINVIQHTPTMKAKTYASWFSEDIDIPLLGYFTIGGVRQIGRFMLYEKSAEVFNAIQGAINKARMDLIGDSRLNIHIFAGISGGTGSGTFLDICYIVRELTKNIPNTTIFGYFFLPDVNLARIPPTYNSAPYVSSNGYAAMQELDFCMNLTNNKAGFDQEYRNGKKVEWKEPPVDMAHLVSVANINSDEIQDPYNYAISVTTEYVLDCLIKHKMPFIPTLVELYAQHFHKVQLADDLKNVGVNCNYCVIGAASARLPLKEIYTYLASHLFNKFSTINTRKPIAREVEKLAAKALGSMNGDRSGIYQSLQNEMEKDAGAGYRPYPDDWKSVKNFGNKALVEWYYDQKAEKIGHLESNGKGLQDKNNPLSLVNKIKSELKSICRDYNKGPIYAYGTLSDAAALNLQNVVNGIREENKEKWDLERAQSTLRKDEYEKARKEFENNAHGGLFSNGKSLFSTYEFRLRALCEHQYYLSFYEKMDALLGELEEQLSSLSSTYFKKLSSIMESLIHIFEENAKDLNDYSISGDGFSMPMLQLSELKPSMDKRIDEINIPQMLDSFMDLMLKNDEIWLREDEAGICRLVNDFFTQTAFSDFSNQTINDFLRIKFGVDGPALVQRILDTYIDPLTEKASPLFDYDSKIWTPAREYQKDYISVPQISTSIRMAAEQKHQLEPLYNVMESELTDRIYVVRVSECTPLAGYRMLEKFSNNYYSSGYVPGRHIYEGNSHPSLKFTNWDELPPIIPVSRVDLNSPDVNPKIKKYVLKSKELFEEAERLYLIDKYTSEEHYKIFEADRDHIKRESCHIELIEEQAAELAEKIETADLDELGIIAEKLAEYKSEILSKNIYSYIKESNLFIPKEGRWKEICLLDNFSYSPVIRENIAESIKQLHKAAEKKQNILDKLYSLESRIRNIQMEKIGSVIPEEGSYSIESD